MEKYKELLEKTVVDISFPEEKKLLCYAKLHDYVNRRLPKTLFRFRECNQNNINAFQNDQLWFSPASSMNDDFDGRPFYRIKELENWKNNLLQGEELSKQIYDFTNKTIITDNMESVLPGLRRIQKVMQEDSVEHTRDRINHILEYVFRDFYNKLEIIEETVRYSTKLACFSEDINSDLMWGHYARNATGFALGYNIAEVDIYDVFEDNVVRGKIFPILYTNSRLDCTEFVKYIFKIGELATIAFKNKTKIDQKSVSNMIQLKDEFMPMKLSLYKSKEWESEKEWRMFYLTKENESSINEHVHFSYRPNSIYLGRKISSEDENILIKTAKEKGIAIYKMYIPVDSKTYKLDFHRIDE